MPATRARTSGAAQRFWSLCREAGVNEKSINDAIKKLSETDAPLARNLRAFIFNRTKRPGRTIVKGLPTFCREHLNFEYPESELTSQEMFVDRVGEFAEANKLSETFLEAICGRYHLYRPRVNDCELKKIESKELIPFFVRISRDGDTNRFAFDYYGRSAGEGRWAGHALSHGRHVYLIGFDQVNRADVMSMILKPLAGLQPSERVLIGAQLMGLSYSENPQQRGMVTGRVVALASVSNKDFMRRGEGDDKPTEKKAKAWLANQQANDSTGFAVDLGLPSIQTIEEH